MVQLDSTHGSVDGVTGHEGPLDRPRHRYRRAHRGAVTATTAAQRCGQVGAGQRGVGGAGRTGGVGQAAPAVTAPSLGGPARTKPLTESGALADVGPDPALVELHAEATRATATARQRVLRMGRSVELVEQWGGLGHGLGALAGSAEELLSQMPQSSLQVRRQRRGSARGPTVLDRPR